MRFWAELWAVDMAAPVRMKVFQASCRDSASTDHIAPTLDNPHKYDSDPVYCPIRFSGLSICGPVGVDV